jgi:hypothetical protein
VQTKLLHLAWIAAALAHCAAAAELKRDTAAAFDRYVRQAETRIQSDAANGEGYLFATTPERRAGLRNGAVLIEPRIPRGELSIPSGLVHDWMGAVFIRGASMGEVLALLQNYDRHRQFYRPEVIDSRVLARDGNDFRVHLRLLKKKVLTVVLDTEHNVHYERVNDKRWWSWSRSSRIQEIQNPGTASEKALGPENGHGFLWRLNSYWTMHEADGGTYVECEAISLTRDVPAAVRWLVEPIIRSLPRDSLSNTLGSTRTAVLGGAER